ncbi:MAG TPA: radical SAM protein [Xanthobacteraceae bacterium]|nr:radical SAM protein [Xanthobacteraceae bacterium]
MLDLTRSHITDKVWLEATSRCNLRCTYCHLSHEDIPEVDIDFTHFDRFIDSLKARHTRELIFNGRGENSFLDGWHTIVGRALDIGLEVTAVTNLSRPYTDEELEAFSRYASITVSVDTTDPAVFRAIRRKADIGLVLNNMLRLRAMALARGRTPPEFVWNMIVHSHSMLDLVRSVSEGIAVGVDRFHLSVLGETPELPGALTPRQIDKFSAAQFAEGLDQIAKARRMVDAAGRKITMSFGLDGLIANLCRRWGIGERPALELTG